VAAGPGEPAELRDVQAAADREVMAAMRELAAAAEAAALAVSRGRPLRQQDVPAVMRLLEPAMRAAWGRPRSGRGSAVQGAVEAAARAAGVLAMRRQARADAMMGLRRRRGGDVGGGGPGPDGG
jgi:hypothetical protein